MKHYFVTILLIITSLQLSEVEGYSAKSISNVKKRENFKTCIAGKFSHFCDYDLLTKKQKYQVRKSEKRENFKNCIEGKDSHSCDYDLLTKKQKYQVRKSEKRENFKICIEGNFPGLCNYNLLTKKQKHKVQISEWDKNAKICLNENLRSYCNRNEFTNYNRYLKKKRNSKKISKIKKKSLRKKQYRNKVVSSNKVKKKKSLNLPENSLTRNKKEVVSDTKSESLLSSFFKYFKKSPRSDKRALKRYGCAENGSCYGDFSSRTGRRKTVKVKGYFRRDGTYVRGHYRSRPRKNYLKLE